VDNINDSNEQAIDIAMETDEAIPNLTEIKDTAIQTESNNHNYVMESALNLNELRNASDFVEDITIVS